MLVTKPELPSLLCMKSGKCFSMYSYKNAWDEVKKRSYREKGATKAVGTILGGEKTGKIQWKDDFIALHPELEDFTAQRKEDGSIVFSPIDTDKQITVKDALSAKKYAAGASWVFDQMIAGTPLAEALNRVFGARNINKKILSLAYFLNMNENNAMSRYEGFAEKHRLPWQKQLTPSAITRIFQNITSDKIDRFIALLNELTMERDEKLKSCKYWALDSTSISTHSVKLAKSAFGHNKDGDMLPQINVLMVVNQLTGEPVYYRTYSGNIPDICTVKHLLQEQARIKLDNTAVLVADKGYSSIKNINRFFQNKVSFLMNLKTSFTMCRKLFKDIQADLLDPASYDEEIDSHAMTVETEWSYPVNYKTNCTVRLPREKDKVYLHFYYNDGIFNSEKKNITAKISKTIKLIKENRELLPNLKLIREIFVTEKQEVRITDNKNKETVVTYATNRKALNNYLLMKGIRVLISNEVRDPIEAHKAYFDRNEVEYAFNLYKQRLGCNRFRVSSNESLEGKAFVQFIATSIAIMFRRRVNNATKKMQNLKLKYDSDSAVIDKLNTIEMTQFSFGNYYTEIVGGLKELLRAMNIPEPSEEFTQQECQEDLNASLADELEEEFSELEISDYEKL